MPDQSAQSDWSQLRCILRELHYIELVQNLLKTKFLARFSRSLHWFFTFESGLVQVVCVWCDMCELW